MAPHGEEPLETCKQNWARFFKHEEESVKFRDASNDHERRLKTVEEYIEKQGNLKLTIIASSMSVIVVILLSCIAWAVAWGQLIEKTNRLERLHPYGSTIERVAG
jgi:hypothetical protein